MYTAALLDPERFQVEILSGPQTGSEGSLIDEVRAREIPLIILPDLLRQISLIHDLQALGKMRRIMRDGGYQIVHTHSSKAGILGRLAAHRAGTPIIVHTVHGWSFHDYMSPLTKMAYILLERWMASFSDAMIVVAAGDTRKGLEAGIGRAAQYHCIRSAIPLDEFDPTKFDKEAICRELGIPVDKIVIGNVGRFSVQKNPLDWSRVAGRIGRACPQAHFMLVGDGPLRREAETEVRAQGIADRTIFTGLRRDAARMLAAMDIFLLTSLWEGLPRVIPQAMAMGLPVVANRADGTTEAIQDGVNGYLCAPGDVDQMAVKCIDLAANPQKRTVMGQRGREFAVNEFDLGKMITKIEALYQNLLEKKDGIQRA